MGKWLQTLSYSQLHALLLIKIYFLMQSFNLVIKKQLFYLFVYGKTLMFAA